MTRTTESEDAQYILDHTEGVVGILVANNIELLPVEPAITNRIREFTQLRFKHRAGEPR